MKLGINHKVKPKELKTVISQTFCGQFLFEPKQAFLTMEFI